MEGMMWVFQKCKSCGCKPDVPYTNSIDKSVMCEKCAVEEYKKVNPFWNVPTNKKDFNIFNDVTS